MLARPVTCMHMTKPPRPPEPPKLMQLHPPCPCVGLTYRGMPMPMPMFISPIMSRHHAPHGLPTKPMAATSLRFPHHTPTIMHPWSPHLFTFVSFVVFGSHIFSFSESLTCGFSCWVGIVSLEREWTIRSSGEQWGDGVTTSTSFVYRFRFLVHLPLLQNSQSPS